MLVAILAKTNLLVSRCVCVIFKCTQNAAKFWSWLPPLCSSPLLSWLAIIILFIVKVPFLARSFSPSLSKASPNPPTHSSPDPLSGLPPMSRGAPAKSVPNARNYTTSSRLREAFLAVKQYGNIGPNFISLPNYSCFTANICRLVSLALNITRTMLRNIGESSSPTLGLPGCPCLCLLFAVAELCCTQFCRRTCGRHVFINMHCIHNKSTLQMSCPQPGNHDRVRDLWHLCKKLPFLQAVLIFGLLSEQCSLAQMLIQYLLQLWKPKFPDDDNVLSFLCDISLAGWQGTWWWCWWIANVDDDDWWCWLK